jgi:transcriptional regulator with XRE-family HTH domain
VTPEHEKARAWRESRGLTTKRLAELSGYSECAIFWFEKGETPPMRNAKGGHAKDRRHKPWVWARYKAACSGVDRLLRTGKAFEW